MTESNKLSEDERKTFVRCLSEEIDRTLEQHNKLMLLYWGSYNPTGRRYYEGPEMRLCKDS